MGSSGEDPQRDLHVELAAEEARLLSRPGRPTPLATEVVPPPAAERTIEGVTYRLGLGGERDGLLFAPTRMRPDEPAPLVVFLHGARASARATLPAIEGIAARESTLVLLPDSRAESWDVITTGFGPDVRFIDRALGLVFKRFAVDSTRIAIAGFSDGASYALSLGLANGELFSTVLAFSPGFAAPPVRRGRPRIYVTHGVRDRVLPIDTASRRLVRRLERQGYEIVYREFDGGHIIPLALAGEAWRWFLGEGPPRIFRRV